MAAHAAARDYFAWDYTTVLNAIFLPLAGVLVWAGLRGESASETSAPAHAR